MDCAQGPRGPYVSPEHLPVLSSLLATGPTFSALLEPVVWLGTKPKEIGNLKMME